MSIVTITGFLGINNMQEPSSLKQPAVGETGDGSGPCELVECVNFDLDDSGGLISRDADQEIFTKPFDAKFTQKMHGRKYTVSANKVFYSKPFSDDKDKRRSMIAYPDIITMIQEVENGLWVSTTKTLYFHKGTNPTELGSFSQAMAYDCPAILGTGEKVHASSLYLNISGFVAVFATTCGICYGDDNGNLTNMSYGTFSYSPGLRGISMIKEKNGMIQYLVRLLDDDVESYNQQQTRTLDIDER